MSGSVLSLYRYPVKSMAGERLEQLHWDARGAAGDRSHALLFHHKAQWRRLTARQSPRLLAWRARYMAEPSLEDPPPPLLEGPDGTALPWDDPRLPGRLAGDLGRAVRLNRDPAGQQDLGRSLLVTLEATRTGLEAELDRPLDLDRFRPNIHLALDAAPFDERGWQGRLLRVGDCTLELLHPCVRCVIPTRDPGTQERWPGLLRHLAREHATLFGINARAPGEGRVRVGDRAELL
ncbi:MAG: MOSC domain-containing protein [Solirubrobacteraceae bacterium]